MLAADADADEADNTAAMMEGFANVRTSEITYAARDSDFDGFAIRQGDYLALVEHQLFGTDQNLSAMLERLDRPDNVVLVDCLTLWLTNLMMENADFDAAFAALEAAILSARAKLIFVSNEVGLGIVPENRMAREFRDHAGRLHQRIAAIAGEVFFVAAGLPLKMKG